MFLVKRLWNSLHYLLENLLHGPDNLGMAIPLPGFIGVTYLIHKLFVESSIFFFSFFLVFI